MKFTEWITLILAFKDNEEKKAIPIIIMLYLNVH